MKKLFILIFGILIIPSLVLASETIEGTIQGYNCVSQQGKCAASSVDPIVSTEYTFVVLTPDGKYYFLPNVPRAVLAYRDTERVRVTGDFNPKYNEISAKRVEFIKNGKWRLGWNRDSEFNPVPVLK